MKQLYCKVIRMHIFFFRWSLKGSYSLCQRYTVARSFWSAPTAGKVQYWKFMIHRLPSTLCMLIIVSLTNLIGWENKMNSLHMLRKLDPSKRHNSWCWPKWVLPLGTKMKGSLNRPWTKMKYLSVWNQWRINCPSVHVHVMFQVSRIVYWSLY